MVESSEFFSSECNELSACLYTRFGYFGRIPCDLIFACAVNKRIESPENCF